MGRRRHEAHRSGTAAAEFPEGERLPRRFEVEVIEVTEGPRQRVQILIDGRPSGQELTDNAYDPDGYRFHDVFHFAYAAVLGWSPITRILYPLSHLGDIH